MSIKEVDRSGERKKTRERAGTKWEWLGQEGWMCLKIGSWRQDLWRKGLAPTRMTPRTLPYQRHDARILAPMTLTPYRYILVPATIAPRTWSIFKNLSARSLFERFFRKKREKNKKKRQTSIRQYWCVLYWVGLETVIGPQYIFQIIQIFPLNHFFLKNFFRWTMSKDQLPILIRLLASLDQIREVKIQLLSSRVFQFDFCYRLILSAERLG
jgi:hypothetical protein